MTLTIFDPLTGKHVTITRPRGPVLGRRLSGDDSSNAAPRLIDITPNTIIAAAARGHQTFDSTH